MPDRWQPAKPPRRERGIGGTVTGAATGAGLGYLAATILNLNCDSFLEVLEGCTRWDEVTLAIVGAVVGAITGAFRDGDKP